jgi:MoaA/NifB/PqqE/SkfB family radical SAM enzyme
MSHVKSVRYGFATNSSSTHSIIITKEKSTAKDNLSDCFGWDFFTAASDQAKRQYLASIVMHHLDPIISRLATRDLIKAWLNIDINDLHQCLGIDHQSMPVMPKTWEGVGMDVDFFNEYKEFLLQKHLVIIGGNDNTNQKHSLAHKYEPFVLPLLYDGSTVNLVARKDPLNGYWTLFNRDNGNKIRLFLSPKQDKITKAFAPELVDLKITDFCDKRCSFCYQGSTKNGEHGNTNYINNVIYMLKKYQIFEVALGGGEPTAHPDFEKILRTCRWNYVIPNFTTKTLDWLKNDTRRNEILSYAGGFAFSVNNNREVRELGFLLEKYGIDRSRVQVQVIDGVVSDWSFPHILKECAYHNLALTILGFKPTGRGEKFADHRQPYKFDWIEMVKKARHHGDYVTIGVDTLIVQKYQDAFREEGIDEIFFTPEEGKFSCYIDGVKQEIGPSSYAPNEMAPFPYDDFSQFLQKFTVY